MKWIGDFVRKYKFDGVRLDATKHVDRHFHVEFEKAAGVFMIGEVYSANDKQLAEYQHCCISSVFNFVLLDVLQRTFYHGISFKLLSQRYW